MKCNSEKATRPAMFSIALALTAAGFLVFFLCVSTTAMATGADTIEQQVFSTDAQEPMAHEAIVPETQDVDTPALEEQASESDGQSVDQSGPQDYNMALGKKRANAVKTFLENLGIASQRLTEVSYGEKSPVRTTTDQTAARINRRVEFKIQLAA